MKNPPGLTAGGFWAIVDAWLDSPKHTPALRRRDNKGVKCELGGSWSSFW
jgi:hypothetical protein